MKKSDSNVLEDGKVLIALADMFNKNRCVETVIPLLACLHDSIVFVPTTAILSERDQQTALNNLEVGSIFTNEDPIRMKPDILKAPDNTLWFPIFSNEESIDSDYKAGFSIIPMKAIDCVKMAHTFEGVQGLVLDAFTNPVPLTFEVADMIETVKDTFYKGQK